MKSIILVCALCLYLGESYAENTDGVGAFAYNGPSGRANPFITSSPFKRFSPFRRSFLNPFSKRFPFGGNFPGFDAFSGPSVGQPYQIPDMSNYNYGRNSAFAGAALGPDFSHQMAGISPSNPNNPNINKFSNIGAQPNGYYSVSSNSMAASTVDSSGKKTETRRAETTVNNNGRVTKYKVEN